MSNQPDEIIGEPAFEKVFTQEETRLFRGTAEVGVREATVFFRKNVKLFPIQGLDGSRIGFASASRGFEFRQAAPESGGAFLVEFAIDYETAERLLIESKSQKLYMVLHTGDRIDIVSDCKKTGLTFLSPIGDPLL